MNDETTEKEFFRCTSQASAQLSAVNVYVMLPNDNSSCDGEPQSVWHNYEWPYLRDEPGKENAKVERVLCLNPDDFSEAQVIYKRKKELAAAMRQEEEI
jgi:hypothetical protein